MSIPSCRKHHNRYQDQCDPEAHLAPHPLIEHYPAHYTCEYNGGTEAPVGNAWIHLGPRRVLPDDNSEPDVCQPI
jgi:hypothetical protein